jgi:hypothetical protein
MRQPQQLTLRIASLIISTAKGQQIVQKTQPYTRKIKIQRVDAMPAAEERERTYLGSYRAWKQRRSSLVQQPLVPFRLVSVGKSEVLCLTSFLMKVV